MIENIRLSFQGIWSHKMRSFLTMLGIIIGIAAIIAIVSTIRGANEQIKNNLIGSGNNTVNVIMAQDGGNEYQISSENDIPRGIPQVTEETKEKILALREVEAVTTYNSRYVSDSVFYQSTALTDLYMYGIDESYFTTCNYGIKSGRGFVPDDSRLFRKVMILDTIAAKSIFQQDNPIGRTMEVFGNPFTIVGVVEEHKQFEPEIETVGDYYTYQNDSNGLIFIPKATWPVVFYFDEPENVTVKAVSTDDMTNAGKKTASILNDTITDKSISIKYTSKDLQAQAKGIQQLKNATNMQLFWVAGISLLVGGIGVMNIMLVSVTERTSEIGLKKAIGARKSTILGQFLTEAAVLTSIGGMLGVGAGVGAAQVIHRVTNTPVAIDVTASIIAVVFSMVIGLVFGFLPSVQAANLDPIEALRRE